MRLHFTNRVWYADASFEERIALKRAGFWWHGGAGGCKMSCAACAAGLGKVWWTSREVNAALLVEHADDAARAALSEHLAIVEASRSPGALTNVADVISGPKFLGIPGATFEDVWSDANAPAPIPVPLGLSYLPYQLAGIAAIMAIWARGLKGALLADEMGLGKTVQAIGAINATPEARRVLIVCPASLRLNWQRELSRWLTRSEMSIRVVTDSKTAIPFLSDGEGQIVIVNYDRLKGRFAELMARKWDLLIADEAHYVKNPRSQRAKALLGFAPRQGKPGARGLVDVSEQALFLTGTPIMNKPIEIHPLLAALDSRTWGHFFNFAKRYCDAHQEMVARNKLVWNFNGASNLEELQEKLRSTVMVRRLKADVLTELPPKRRQVIVLPAEGRDEIGAIKAEIDAYDEIVEESETEVACATPAVGEPETDEYKSAIAKLKSTRAIAFEKISGARREVAIAKAPRVIEHVQSMLDDGVSKIVVMVHHRDVAKMLHDEFKESNGAVVLTGETPMADRQAAVDRFQNDESCRVFVGSIMAAGVGITLTAASTVVFAELDWVPANVTQAEDRLHRIGQTESVLVQHLVLDGSLDQKMVETIISKQSIADSSLDKSTSIEIPTVDTVAVKKYEPVAVEKKEVALRAIKFLAMRCDGACAEDGSGFNKIDSRFGHKLAQSRSLSDGQAHYAIKLARKYRRQLPIDIRDALLLDG